MAHKNESNWSPYKGPKTNRLRGRHKKPVKIFSFSEADDRLRDIFRNHEFGHIPHSTRHQLVQFYQLLMKSQQKENFTRLLSLKDIAIKHFIDSIIVTQYVDLRFPLLDMGTGPGFPGLPLRFVVPEKNKILLAEGVQKRVAFLKKVREELRLTNLDIIGRNVNREFHYPVQGVITRAVEDARNTLGNVMNCLQTGGQVYLMKGPNVAPEIALAKKEWGEYFKLEKDIAYTIPETQNRRRLLVYTKIGHKQESI